jgi:hypothetical protein
MWTFDVWSSSYWPIGYRIYEAFAVEKDLSLNFDAEPERYKILPRWGAKYVSFTYHSVALVRKRTTLTERPSYVDEVSANFCG